MGVRKSGPTKALYAGSFDPVTRGQMAVFLARTFGLTLYGP